MVGADGACDVVLEGVAQAPLELRSRHAGLPRRQLQAHRKRRHHRVRHPESSRHHRVARSGVLHQLPAHSRLCILQALRGTLQQHATPRQKRAGALGVGVAGDGADLLVDGHQREEEDLLRDRKQRRPARLRRRPLVAGVHPERPPVTSVEAVLLGNDAGVPNAEVLGVVAVAQHCGEEGRLVRRRRRQRRAARVHVGAVASAVAVERRAQLHRRRHAPDAPRVVAVAHVTARHAGLEADEAGRSARIEGADVEERLERLQVCALGGPLDGEGEGAVEGVPVGVEARRVQVVVGRLVEQRRHLPNHFRFLALAVVLHDVDRDHVFQLQRHPASVEAVVVGKVGFVALDDQRHQPALDAVRVDLRRTLRRQLRGGNIGDDAEAGQLVHARCGANHNVHVRHVLEVGLAGDAVTEDVDAAGNNRDRRRERRLHLLRALPVVGGGPLIDGVAVRGAHHHRNEHLLREVRGVGREPVDAERDVERDKLVRDRHRVVAHGCGGRAELRRSRLRGRDQRVELSLAGKRVVRVLLAGGEEARRGAVLGCARHKRALTDQHRVERDEALVLVGLGLRAERERDLQVVCGADRVGAREAVV
mmetsp:Transcript_14104/g.28039  ORF Transcript_14104/g.28039 Transcript_14104/m.28039 type:complete len:592 (-) Transcript_14104:373-2148(-)